MFERYTEKARRVIFFARFEASQYGSPYIETEHLLLGLLREDRRLANLLSADASTESIRKEIESRITVRERISTSVEVRLTQECKRILNYSAEEAERLGHKHVATEHLLLGILREEKCLAADILQQGGLRLATAREKLERDLGQKSALLSHRAELADLLRKKSLMRGEFTLSSGKKSDYYLDCRVTTLDARGALLTGYCILEVLDQMKIAPDAIGGLSMGADPVVSAAIVVSAIEKRPVPGFLVRKEAKKHGRQKQIEGIESLEGKKVAIVDDACTTGGSTQEAINAVEGAGAQVVAVISLVDREEGGSSMLRSKYNYRSVFTARELLADTNPQTGSAAP
ncbi:MAG: orotate phosphoribosyltransferase [Candidatus Acidiferrales bacterium]